MVIKVEVGTLETNCYIFYDESTLEAVIIDPGDESDKIIKQIEKNHLKPKMIINTHCHFDHVGANADLSEKYNIPIAISKLDIECLSKAHIYAKHFIGKNIRPSPYPEIFIHEGDILNVGRFKIEIIETPGHTPGSVSLYQKELNILFSGDTLFFESVGRWDLPEGNGELLIKSVKRLLSLPLNTVVYPGHGPTTTISHEKIYNPFIQSLKNK